MWNISGYKWGNGSAEYLDILPQCWLDTKGYCPSVNFILLYSSITKGQCWQILVDDSKHSVPKTFVTLLILETRRVHWSYPVQLWVLTFKQTSTSHTLILQKAPYINQVGSKAIFLKHLWEKFWPKILIMQLSSSKPHKSHIHYRVISA